jgi:putative transcriptional regulator
MTKRNLAKELIEGLEEIRAWKRGEVKLKTHSVELPRAADVPQIRKALGYSQEQFASLMGVSVATLRNWEQARREPHGPARSLLLVAATNPAAVRGAFEKLARIQRKGRAARPR